LKLLPEVVNKNALRKFERALNSIKEGMPIQYITKVAKFYGREFYIEKGVFIPRLDSEYLIDIVIEKLKSLISNLPEHQNNHRKIHFLDIGCGSGALSVTLLLEENRLYATCVDISKKALKITFLNSCKYKVQDRLELLRSDVFEALDEKHYNKYHFIICNPPYVPLYKYKKLHRSIFYEPKNAIVAKDEGMKVIKDIIAGYKKYIKDKGFVVVEFPLYNLKRLEEELAKKKIINFKIFNENNTGFAMME
jgi:release factor glutamine methyltransferase